MKRVMVIGASSGLGMEIARIYASRGDMVGVAARRLDRLDALASDFPANMVTASIDVTAPDASDRLLNLVKRLGGTDLIINAAGIGYMNPSLEQNRDMATVATNCLGFTAIADTAFNYFAARPEGGQFAAITSVAASRGLALGASYSASKRFQEIGRAHV